MKSERHTNDGKRDPRVVSRDRERRASRRAKHTMQGRKGRNV